MAEEKSPLEEATEKGYFGADPGPAARAETREADQTQGGPVVSDDQRDPVSAERKDTDEAGNPLNLDASTTSRTPAKAPKQRAEKD